MNRMHGKIKRFMKVSHTGFIYLCDLDRVKLRAIEKDIYSYCEAETKDLTAVSDFYCRTGHSGNTCDKLDTLIASGSKVYVAKLQDKIVAAALMLCGGDTHSLEGFSKYVFITKLNHGISFDENVMYGYNIVVDPSYRKQHIFYNLLTHIIQDLKVGKYSKILMTTGCNNWAMIHTLGKDFELIGVVRVRVWFRCLLLRDVVSLKTENICWQTE